MPSRASHERTDDDQCYCRTREDFSATLRIIAANNGLSVEEVLTAGGPGGHVEWVLRPVKQDEVRTCDHR